ncbi:parallel beta helix pectate lyase-like protein [Actinomadura pelletieri DSM 43383]|uniref:Parallel beta helix pectate lyase-like protein n=1 Tax=Actinomadura pelletieri DSM 43383 TaxID=1120940 RepID=A0A495QZW3_9ACTN|nr:right-handed parallel beta-helix repeat-containing protein [Actinomadura pelletieri]RKS79751.1 parallel beta helix pectate lyase-like protein [Actinomadura pelletieri DSM 43383]
MSEISAPHANVPALPHDAEPPKQKKGRGRRVFTTVLVLGLVGGGVYGYRVYSERTAEPPDVNDVSAASARQQSELVDQEDVRIMQIRAKQESDLAGGGAAAQQARSPRMLNSANGRTLMLPQRREPYYVAELAKLAGEDFQKQSDGSYLLRVNVVVASGGKLILQSSTGPLTIRMRSVPGSFTSIVSTGGNVKINGSAQNPVHITSWNEGTHKPDTRVEDGRAYIRAIGGSFSMTHAEISELGFWSGRTGGIALTGSDRPDSTAERSVAAVPPRAVALPNGTREPTRGGRDEVEVGLAGKAGRTMTFSVPAASLVTGTIDQSTFRNNAYGVFVTAANQTRLTNSTITGSLVHGVLLHRFAKNATIENTKVSGSRGDGFVLSRGTEGVRITNCTSDDNGGNGFTLNGQPFAEGPSASGEATTAFGQNLVSSSIAKNNGHYGFEVLGGDDIAIQNSRVVGGQMGIVAREQAVRVHIAGNQVRDADRQGIVLRDGVRNATVSGNIVTDSRTALYIRDSSGAIRGNTVQSATRHAITLKGKVEGAVITGNTFSGSGRGATDYDRAVGRYQSKDNNTMNWNETVGLKTWLKRIFKPMNVIWGGVFLLVIISVFRSRNAGLSIGRIGVHPYEQQRALEERPVRLLRHDVQKEPIHR